MDREFLVDVLSDFGAIDGGDLLHFDDHFFGILDNKPGNILSYDFAGSALVEGDDRCAAGHGFNHDHTERFGPFYRIE